MSIQQPGQGTAAAEATDGAGHFVKMVRVNAALSQGLRDFFGAHTYQRTDADGTVHTLWSGDRSEIRVD
jgi:6-phosphogluconate dehydrogenase